jgi:hypothetical protein
LAAIEIQSENLREQQISQFHFQSRLSITEPPPACFAPPCEIDRNFTQNTDTDSGNGGQFRLDQWGNHPRNSKSGWFTQLCDRFAFLNRRRVIAARRARIAQLFLAGTGLAREMKPSGSPFDPNSLKEVGDCVRIYPSF